jgi:transposase
MKILNLNIYNADKANLSNDKQFHKHLLDLVRKRVSINAIKNHFKDLFDIHLNRNEIVDIIKRYSKIAKRKNRLLDEYICKQLYILEIDEIFKGQKYMLLVVVDKVTGYVYLIQSLPDRKTETIINALQPLKHLFQKVEIIFTDGASYYPEVVRELFLNAIHFICLLHVLRNLTKRTFPKKKAYKNATKKYMKHQLKIQEFRLKSKERIHKLHLLEKKKIYYTQRREILRARYGFLPYQKNIKGLHHDYDKCSQKLNEIKSKQRSLTRTIENNKIQIERA